MPTIPWSLEQRVRSACTTRPGTMPTIIPIRYHAWESGHLTCFYCFEPINYEHDGYHCMKHCINFCVKCNDEGQHYNECRLEDLAGD